MKIVHLTTKYLTNPLGIDIDSIHFGWRIESDKIGAKQEVYADGYSSSN